MDALTLLKMAAATWYVAYVITSTHGPGGVFEWLRNHVSLGGLTACIVCLSIWVAIILLLVPDGIIVQALAVAGIAMWAHGFTNWRLG